MHVLKHSLLVFITLGLSLPLAGQDIAELERRNGFKDLNLGMSIDSVKAEKKFRKEFKEQDQYTSKLYTVSHPSLETIGEIAISRVEIKTYNDLVYQIHVVTNKDPRLMKALESIYGRADYDLKKETYFWKGNTLILKFRSFSRNQLELIYTSYVILKMMKDDKGKKVDEIADDF